MAKRHSTLIVAVGYARRSTDLQDRSIPDQMAYIEKWAKEHGYRILRWYVDDAISGTSTRGRDDFGRMLDTAEGQRDFDTVLCYDISRFSRGGTNETGYYLHRLKLAGVNALFPADGIPDGDDGELIQGVKSWQARQYSIKLARDSIRGQISSIRERRSAPGGPPPYGYDKQHVASDGTILRTLRWLPDGSKQEFGPDGKLLRIMQPGVNIKKAKSDIIRFVPSLSERVEVVQRMFDWCVTGYGYYFIASTLNDEGIPSPGGMPWKTTRIAKILKNPVYRGAIAWNRHTSGSLFCLEGDGTLRPKQKMARRMNKEEDWILSEGVHEPLVSPDRFQLAQKAIAKRHRAGGRASTKRRALLSSLMICTNCGHNFVHRRDRRYRGRDGDGYRSYSDAGYHRRGKAVCKHTNIPADALDDFVVKTIKRLLLADHGKTKQAVDAFVKAAMKPKKRTPRPKPAKRELDLINRKIKTVLNMLADPVFDGLDEIQQTLADLKAKRDKLQARMKPDQPPEPRPAEKELREWAERQFRDIDRLTAERTSELADRQLVESYVDRIEINPHDKTGVVVLRADLKHVHALGSTHVPNGEGPGVRVFAQHIAIQSHRLINQMRRHKLLVQRDPQSRPVGDFDAAIGRLNSFVRQLMPHGDILDAIFEQKGIAAGAEPLDTGGNCDRTGVGMVTRTCADLLHAGLDVGGIRKSIAGQIDLIDVQCPAIQQRAKRFASTLPFSGCDCHWGAIAQPDIAVDIVLPQRFFQPLDVELRKCGRSP
ncbi:Recombinase [Symmachiella macrocystis]|uniref:Recombinase n=1 Tax=Symmachiella macrocystis TaxID=2527985 RepID=A0A5C6BRA5_9PLAN|nr:Recombinase [Symmachiella macrocystis]